MNDTRIVSVEVEDLDIPLREPFGIATGAQLAAQNLLVRVRLAGGAVGLGVHRAATSDQRVGSDPPSAP